MTGAAAAARDAHGRAEVLRASGRVVESTIDGISMGAALPAGTRIRIRGGEADRLAVGDVVAFLRDGTTVAHRLLARRRGWLVTRGDHWVVPDAPVASDQVLGTVVARLHGDTWEGVPPPQAPTYRGWRSPAARLLGALVGTALALDVRLATAVVNAARWARRGRAVLAGTGARRDGAAAERDP